MLENWIELVLLFALEESDPLQEMKTERLRIIIATKEIFISKYPAHIDWLFRYASPAEGSCR